MTERPFDVIACSHSSRLHTAHCSNGEGHPHRDCYCGVYWNDSEPKAPCPECEEGDDGGE